jgi:hypothetical protein
MLWQEKDPDNMTPIIKYVYERTAISPDKGISTRQRMEMVNQGARQDCPFSPILICIYIYIYIWTHAASSEWQMQLKSHFSVGTTILDTLLFTDDQVICAK